MSLTKEKIVANATKYFETAEKHGFATPELQEFLGLEFVGAPASTYKHLHNAFEGGLIDHTLRVMKHAYYINKNNLIDELKVSDASLFKVVLLHGIGKAKLYVKETDGWWIKNRGRMYNFNDELASMNIGERSVYYALKCNVELTEDECSAIVNYDKIDDSKAEWHNTTMGDVLKMAVRLAILEEKALANEG